MGKKIFIFTEQFLPTAGTIGAIIYRILKNIEFENCKVFNKTKINEIKLPEWLFKSSSKIEIESVNINSADNKNILLNIFFQKISRLRFNIKYNLKFISILLKKADVVITSTMPPGYHKYGYIYKIIYPKTKWIAFFSDPYSNSPFELFGNEVKKDKLYLFRKIYRFMAKKENSFQKKLLKIEEKLVFKYADKIIYVSEAQRKFCYKGESQEEQTLIFPFYYLDDWKRKIEKNIKSKQNYNKKFINIVHPGNIYGNRKPDEFFKALKKFEEKIHYYNCGIFDKELIKKYKLENTVVSLGHINYEILLENIREADYVIVIDSFFKSIENPYMPSKVVDAMYFDKPIIAITNKGTELDKFCKITGNISIENNSKEIENVLTKILEKQIVIKPQYNMFCDINIDII